MTAKAPEPIIRQAPTELSSAEKIAQIPTIASQVSLQKTRLSPITDGRTLEDVAEELRLNSFITDPEDLLQKEGVAIIPGVSDLRKGDMVTTAIAASLLREPTTRNDPETVKAAALLLTTNYASQAELRTMIATAQRQNNSEGARSDSLLIAEKTSGALLRQVELGNVDRLLATTVASLAREENLSVTIATDIARALALNQPPAHIESAAILPRARTVYEIAKTLKGSLPRAGLRKDDVPFHVVSDIALRVFSDAQKLANPLERRQVLTKLVETGSIPDRIESLTDILRIVDANSEIRGVSLDMYDTLVQWTADYWDRFGQFVNRSYKHAQKLGFQSSQKQFEQVCRDAWTDRWNSYQAHGTEVPWGETIEDVIRRLASPSNLSDSVKQRLSFELEKEWYRVELETAVVMPGAREMLAGLKDRGIKIALTSNASWTQAHIRRVLNQFGLLDYFDAISISSDIRGMKKPWKTDLFHYSWSKLRLQYNNILHIGDNPWDDVEGARHSGAKASQYDNPIAFKRLDVDAKFKSNPRLYAETAVHMEREALDYDLPSWLATEMRRHNVPEQEQNRVKQMAKEVYTRSREIFAPAYIALSEKILQHLQQGKTDQVLCLARDGLPLAITLKLLRHFERDRYDKVESDNIKYIFVSRDTANRAANPKSAADREFRERYLSYLRQKGVLGQGKKTLITDLICASGSTHRLLSQILHPQKTEGMYLENHQPQHYGFLQTTTKHHAPILTADSLLFHFESLLNGPKESVQDYEVIDYPGGRAIRPVVKEKNPSPDALSRGLSRESVVFMSYAATKGVIDAVRIHHRANLAGIHSDNEEIARKFIDFLTKQTSDDVIRSIPWQEKGKWILLKE